MSQSSPLRWLMIAASACSLCFAVPISALAHADLLNSVPAADAAIKSAPPEIRLSFSERIELAFSKVSLTGADKEKVDTGPAALDAKDDKVLVVPVKKPLAPGTYAVDWSAVSADGHKSKGGFHFTVE